MTEQTFSIFLVLNSQGTPYPCTASSTAERARELATVAFAAPWPVLEREGWQLARGQLVILDRVNCLEVQS